MTGITVTNANGVSRVVADIAPYVAERAEIVGQLERLYAQYEGLPEDALAPHEATICLLVNSYHEQTDWIDRYEQQVARRANIEAGRTLLKQIRAGQPRGDQS